MSENTVRVRVAGSQFRYDREQYTRDDVLEVAEETLAKHPRTLAPVEEDGGDQQVTLDDANGSDESDGSDGSDGSDDYEVDPHPSDLTVAELRDRVGDVDDVGLLEAIHKAETDGEQRSTAIDAIEDRIDELED